MGHTWKNKLFLKDGSNLQQWVTLEEMGQTSENGLHIEKVCHTRRICQSSKNGSHFKKWVTLRKMGLT